MGGRVKAFLELGGKPLIDRALLAEDRVKGIGPLGGIHAGLWAASQEAVFFAACYMPFLSVELIQEQVHLFQARGGYCFDFRG